MATISFSGLQLNPHIAKPLSSGQVQCLVCSQQVKPKIWVAHVNGKKHKESVERLKKQLVAAPKRSAEPSREDSAPKKSKQDDTSSSGNGELPADFFDSDATAAGSSDAATPWQKQRHEEASQLKETKGVIEGVPLGFFDDKKKDSKVREAVEREAHLEEEFDRWQREVNQQQTVEETKADEEAEREALDRDLDNIDEQMERLQKLNEVEKRKEEVLHKASNTIEKMAQDDSGDDEITEEDMDFSNWRKKRIY